MKKFDVIRKGKCIECGQSSEIIIDTEIEAETKEQAVDIAQERWNYEQFGQAGSLREKDIVEEELFLQGDFIAEETK